MTTPSRPHLQLVSRDGMPVKNGCEQVASTYRLSADLLFDSTEQVVLNVIRQICAAFGEERVMAFDVAHEVAEQYWGQSNGAQVVGAVTALLRAVRRERGSPFGYMSSDCPVCRLRITNEEAGLMQVLRAERFGNCAGVRRLIKELTDVEQPAMTAEAFHLLAITLRPPLNDPQPNSIQRPPTMFEMVTD